MGRTLDTVIAAMKANHPGFTTQKTLYVEISRARDRAELVTEKQKGTLHPGEGRQPAMEKTRSDRWMEL